MTIWEIIHIIEIILWFVIAGSVVYVVFFAIISLFYEPHRHPRSRPQQSDD